MALVFFDTNLVLALFNPHDRLHDNVAQLSKKENVILLGNAQMEARATFLRKFNTAVLEVYKILNKAREAKTELQLQEIMVREFKKLINARPDYDAFYKFIYGEMQKFGIKTDNLLSIPGFLNERALAITTAIAVTQTKVKLDIDTDKQKKIEEAIKDVRFKDFMDLNIFCETLAVKTEDDLVLMTNDSEFYKKSKRALEILESKSILKKLRVEVRIIK